MLEKSKMTSKKLKYINCNEFTFKNLISSRLQLDYLVVTRKN